MCPSPSHIFLLLVEMKTPEKLPVTLLLRCILGFITVTTHLPPLSAQTSAPASSEPSPPKKTPAKETKAKKPPVEEDDDALELSPFEVHEERDRGLEASTVGTGSRMALEMRTAPVPFSAINQEMIQALGIMNMQEAAGWSTSGDQSKFDANGGGDTFGLYVTYGVRGQSSGSSSTQGLQQRDYYQNASTMNSYNVERYEFGRGPNAALFGIGLLTGSQSAQSKQAHFRTFAKVTTVFGSWDRYRASVDLNRKISDKFALRINAIEQRNHGWRLNEQNNFKGATINFNYRPNKTIELRLDASLETLSRTDPYSTISDHFSAWDGVTVFSGPVTDAVRSANATPGAPNAFGQKLTYFGEPQGVDRRPANYNVFIPSGPNIIMDYTNFARTRQADDSSDGRTPVYLGDLQIIRANNPNTATTSYNVNATNLFDAPDFLPEIFDHAVAVSSFRRPSERFSMANREPFLTQRNRNLTLTFTKRWAESLFLEIGANANQVPTHTFAASFYNDLRTIDIDIDKTLPNGQPNPHFLQLYGDGQVRDRKASVNAESVRANLAYRKDLGRWGKYNLNLNASSTFKQIQSNDYALSLAHDPDPRLWQTNDLIRLRTYWNDTDRPYSRDMLLRPITFVDWDYTDPNNPVSHNVTVNPRWVITGRSKGTNEWVNGGAQLQAKYFNRLTFLLNYRTDLVSGTQRNSVAYGDLPADWDGETLPFKPNAPSDWLNLTYIPVNASGAPTSSTPVLASTRPRTTVNGLSVRNPLYANARFRDDYNNPQYRATRKTSSYGATYEIVRWALVYGNFSNAYNPPDIGVYTLDNLQKLPTDAYSYEFGARFFLFNDHLQLRYNRFESRREHEGVTSPIIGDYNTLTNANNATSNLADDRNSLGIPNLSNGDYQNSRNYGNEIEITANLARGWRVTGNFGDNKQIRTSRFPLSKAFMADPTNQNIFRQLLESAGGRLDTTQHPNGAPGLAIAAPAGTYPAGTPLRDQTSAINAYNNLWLNAFAQLTNDSPVFSGKGKKVNLYSDYTIQKGWFKRLRVGFGLQWRDKIILADRSRDTIVDPTNPAKAIDDPTKDVTTYIWSRPLMTAKGTLAYMIPMKKGRSVEFNLVVDNLFNDRHPLYQSAQFRLLPVNGDFTSPARVTTMVNPIPREPINFMLTTTVNL